jgi:hypothetical protein
MYMILDVFILTRQILLADKGRVDTFSPVKVWTVEQRTNRKYVMGAIDKDLANKRERRKRRED